MLNPQSEYTFADGVFRRRRKRISKKILSTSECQERAPADDSRLPARDESSKFSSSFAIDSILSKPFTRREQSTEDTCFGTRLMLSAAPHFLPVVMGYPPQTGFQVSPEVSSAFPIYRCNTADITNISRMLDIPNSLPGLAHSHTTVQETGYHPFRIDSLLSWNDKWTRQFADIRTLKRNFFGVWHTRHVHFPLLNGVLVLCVFVI